MGAPERETSLGRKLANVAAITTILAFIYAILKTDTPSQNKFSQVNIQSSFPDSNTPVANDRFNKSGRKANVRITQNQLPRTELQNEEADVTDYISSTGKTDVAIVIANQNQQPATPTSSAIENIYREKGLTTTHSLFSNNFYHSKYFDKLAFADSKTIDKLSLVNYTNVLVVGKYGSSFRDGSGEFGKVICDATLEIIIISSKDKSQINSFTLSASNGGFDDRLHAEKGAIEKLINQYRAQNLNL